MAFEANASVSLVKNIAKYTNISNCWLCGQANDFNSPHLGVPDEFKARNRIVAEFESLF